MGYSRCHLDKTVVHVVVFKNMASKIAFFSEYLGLSKGKLLFSKMTLCALLAFHLFIVYLTLERQLHHETDTTGLDAGMIFVGQTPNIVQT